MTEKIRSLRKWFVSMLVMVILFGGVNFTIAEESSGSSKSGSKAKSSESGSKSESGEKKKDSGSKSGGGYGGSRSRRSSGSK